MTMYGNVMINRMNMGGNSIQNPHRINTSDKNEKVNHLGLHAKFVPGTSMQGHRAKPRINTSMDYKFNNSYLKNVGLNDTLRIPNANIFTNNFMVSNAMKLTPRQINRRFVKHTN